MKNDNARMPFRHLLHDIDGEYSHILDAIWMTDPASNVFYHEHRHRQTAIFSRMLSPYNGFEAVRMLCAVSSTLLRYATKRKEDFEFSPILIERVFDNIAQVEFVIDSIWTQVFLLAELEVAKSPDDLDGLPSPFKTSMNDAWEAYNSIQSKLAQHIVFTLALTIASSAALESQKNADLLSTFVELCKNAASGPEDTISYIINRGLPVAQRSARLFLKYAQEELLNLPAIDHELLTLYMDIPELHKEMWRGFEVYAGEDANALVYLAQERAKGHTEAWDRKLLSLTWHIAPRVWGALSAKIGHDADFPRKREDTAALRASRYRPFMLAFEFPGLPKALGINDIALGFSERAGHEFKARWREVLFWEYQRSQWKEEAARLEAGGKVRSYDEVIAEFHCPLEGYRTFDTDVTCDAGCKLRELKKGEATCLNPL